MKYRKTNDILLKKLKIVMFPLIILIALFSMVLIMDDKLDSASFKIRMDDYTSSFRAWKDKPLFGNGFGNSESIIKYMRSNRYSGTSNSIGVLLAQGGIYLLLLYVLPIIIILHYSKKHARNNYIDFTMIIIIIYVCISLTYLPIILNFLSLGISFYRREELKYEI